MSVKTMLLAAGITVGLMSGAALAAGPEIVSGPGADPQLDTPRERCWVYRELAAWSRGFSRERYDALAGCAEFPFDAFPW